MAVSGGLDSVVMLHILHGIQARLKVSLQVATFNHGWRADATDDVNLVRSLADRFGLPLHTSHADPVPANEAEARQARYAFLAEVAREMGAKTVVTAHHADDQVETILLNLLRGTGLDGLRGMQPVAPLLGASDLRVVRPLLDMSKAELRDYAALYGLVWREDSSNMDTAYTRNAIRHDVLPVLKNINPAVGAALLRLSESAAVERDYLDVALLPEIEQRLAVADGVVSIPRDVFGAWHSAVRRRALRYALQACFPQIEAGYTHIVHAERVGLTGEVGTRAQFPAGVHLRVDYDDLVIERASEQRSYAGLLLPPDFVPLQLSLTPGITAIPGADWRVGLSFGLPEPPYMRLVLPHDRAKLTLRGRQRGDRIKPPGMDGHSRKLKDWLIDQKVPQLLRDRLPLLEYAGEIVALYSVGQWFAMYENDTANSSFIIFVKIYV